MSAQVAADLRAAAEVLRRDGWTQEEFVRPGGCKCALGAIVYAATDGDAARPSLVDSNAAWSRYIAAKNAMRDAVGPYYEDAVGVVSEWNDAPGRTADEVIAALEAAADAAEADQ